MKFTRIPLLRGRTTFPLGLALVLFLTACTPQRVVTIGVAGQSAAQQALLSNSLGERAAAEPMYAVENYLRRYQPGPEPRLFQTTRIYDRNGTLLAELWDEGRRTWVPLERISPYLIDATIATEDSSFFRNPGIDPRRIAGALLQNAQEGDVVSGASTITMQLARNLFLPPDDRFDQSFDRKAREAALAQELTRLYSKNELLEMYLNLLNYGQLTYGPEAAAQAYFGKSAAELTLAEATLMAGIPQQPANLNPYTHFEAARTRQRLVLDLMVRHGYLSIEEADAAFAQEITPAGDAGIKVERAPHFVQYVIETLDAQYGDGFTRRSGWSIYTTLDIALQDLAQEIVATKVTELQPQYDLSNAALVAMAPASGEILVMVGSADFNNQAIAGQVNVAVSPRQPGSAIKPILYAAALDQNRISPASVIWDTPVRYRVAETGAADDIYRPQNYDRIFHGPVSVRTALANSYNVPAVKLLDAFSVESMLTQAQAMGLVSLNRGPTWYGLSLTLGGGEVTLLELTSAYRTLAAGGVYRDATPIRLIADNLGQQVPYARVAPQSVVSPTAAFQITDILSDNVARIPAFGENSILRISRPAAVKTGTTTDWRDNWTVGYTRHLVTGVWAGNSDGRPMRNASGVTGAAPIWSAFMEGVLADPALLARLDVQTDDEAWQFTPPPDVEQRDECPPGVRCREGGEWFSRSWLEAMGEQGPLGDSVVDLPAAPVYSEDSNGQRRAGFCTLDNALARTLLRPPGNLARTENNPEGEADNSPETDATNSPQRPTSGPGSLAEEQGSALAWALQYGSQMNLGPCSELDARVGEFIRNSPSLAERGVRLVVDMAAAGVADVAETPGADATAATEASTPSPAFSGAPGSYALSQPVWHDANCPGQYIMGRILNLDGAPVAGVRVQARDEWGNVFEAVSKAGATDAGMFDFLLVNQTPQIIQVLVLDGAGNPISPSIAVEHYQGAAGTAPCHHLVFRGG
ncbi:MAG: transglycosylase domain-containing protein [Caldilineaceae bacterium]|nr:transglycosylase domain-containing protein [Caldilineaceae bacterium]